MCLNKFARLHFESNLTRARWTARCVAGFIFEGFDDEFLTCTNRDPIGYPLFSISLSEPHFKRLFPRRSGEVGMHKIYGVVSAYRFDVEQNNKIVDRVSIEIVDGVVASELTIFFGVLASSCSCNEP